MPEKMTCANGGPLETEHHNDDLKACDQCGTVLCAPCREAITGSRTMCPTCGVHGFVDLRSCRTGGGCGN